MNNKLFVGNLSYKVTEQELESIFTEAGTVASATIATDRQTGRARGFGFVEMADPKQAETAIQMLNGRPLLGRPMSVSISQPKPRSPFSGR